MKKISKTKLSSTYALAIYESAVEKKDIKKVYEDMNKLREALTSENIKNLSSPLLNTSVKQEIIKEICKKFKICDVVCNSLDVIAENERLGDLKYIFEAFNNLYYEKNDMILVKVYTIKELNSSQDKKLKENLHELLKKEVIVNYEIKPEILGGLVINFGSSQIDDSIKGKLERLESVMKGGK
ncbi:MAG: ATP synthase F1 subunit delta [Alphaproteobacteria bacterium]